MKWIKKLFKRKKYRYWTEEFSQNYSISGAINKRISSTEGLEVVSISICKEHTEYNHSNCYKAIVVFRIKPS